MRGDLQVSTGLWAGWTVFFAQPKSDPPTSGLLAEMEPQEAVPLPTPATKQPRPSEADGTAGESAEGMAGMHAKEAALGDKGLGGAEDHGGEAKGSSGAVVEDAGSEAKGGSGAVVEDAGSEAKGGSGAVVEDAGSEAKGGSGVVVEDAGSEAKVGSEAGGAEDAGSETKVGSGVGGPEVRAEEGVGSKAVETAGVGVSGAEPQEEAAGTKPEKEVAEERGAGAPGKEERTASTSEEPVSLDLGEEEEYWPELAPSSPDQGPASPTGSTVFAQDTGGSQSGASKGQEGSASPGEAMQQPRERSTAPEGAAPPKEKPKRPALDRRELTRPRLGPRTQSRKAIVEKFGGAASGPAPNIKRTGGTNAIKNMLLEWCRAKTRGYEHVDIVNFSSSWSSGLAFCALVHKFFPDAFDYAALTPENRRENFTLAFATAEKHADCAPLLEVDDMVRMSVPDSKCVYTYLQELYRSLVNKGLVKTKKR
ncbi:smoothelin-like protein 1 isoform X2 [Alligator sinensis]|uniref:Smoothelin-like protein 1 isoform X2 n=1 Tax=Alligator sinensis TaxID=38654 RepID=A0A3Q0HL19_ALLSI|nr:smoothelin-like protein 1 isoform X2 [Alligator sinensis]